jgi:ribonuclease P/MRP protein subunit POP5
MKLRPLLPSLREKKRYIAFEVETEGTVDLDHAKKSIEQSMKGFLGDLGMARAGVLFLNDWKYNRGIIKVNTKYVDEVKASLALVQDMMERKAIVRSVGVSGALEKIRESYFKGGN